MTRGKAIFLIAVAFILVFGGILGSYIYFSKNKNQSAVEEIRGAFRSFFPFGGETRSGGETAAAPEGGFSESAPAPALRKISNEPVAGFTAFSAKAKEGSKDADFIRFVQRATGHVYETKANDLKVERISNTTLPKINEAFWLSTTSVVYRYLDDNGETIKTFRAGLVKKNADESGGEPYAIGGAYLEDNIKEMAVSKEGNIFYLTTDIENSYGTRMDAPKYKAVSLFKSNLREWLPAWTGGKTIWLSGKPSFSASGYVYSLGSQSGTFTKVFGGPLGLAILPSPDNTKLLYSHMAAGAPDLLFYDIKSAGPLNLYLNTFSEKCVWANTDKNMVYCAVPKSAPSASLPDDWHKGKVFFVDSIWKVNVESGATELVSSVSDEAGEDIDAVNLVLTPDDAYLVFQNKKDLSLWSLNVKDAVPSDD